MRSTFLYCRERPKTEVSIKDTDIKELERKKNEMSAEKNLMEGDTLKAQMYLEDCLRTRVTTYHEYDMAKAELRAIKGGSQEP